MMAALILLIGCGDFFNYRSEVEKLREENSDLKMYIALLVLLLAIVVIVACAVFSSTSDRRSRPARLGKAELYGQKPSAVVTQTPTQEYVRVFSNRARARSHLKREDDGSFLNGETDEPA
jgi:heme/copper-type cytochrome/quinol oxidase subunit 2